MSDLPNVSGEHYILATISIAGRKRVLKHSGTFGVFDPFGDLTPFRGGEQGLFHDGTRFLSRETLRVNGRRPLLLSSDITRDNHLIAVDLTNTDLHLEDGTWIPRGTIHLFRSRFLWEGRCYEKIRIRNFGLAPIAFDLAISFDADFADIFEVRGLERKHRGELAGPRASGHCLEFPYTGLDGIPRLTRIEFTPQPEHLERGNAGFRFNLAVGNEIEVEVVISCIASTPESSGNSSWQQAYGYSAGLLDSPRGQECSVTTSNEEFNSLLGRATSDLRMLLTCEEGSLYPYAGIPWFNTPFGRDALITALETLWFNPDISRGVLEYLSRHQAGTDSPMQDAEPGKILHEVRVGEMVNTGELPFSMYYGSADSTPLFVMLAGRYARRTGDLDFIERLWPSIERALEWIDSFGDRDGDGFVEYRKRSGKGIDNQGWKDSFDSIFHDNGRLAQPPVALCEIQGYVFAAWREAAFLAGRMRNTGLAHRLREKAARLREAFDASFWDDELGCYVLALDADKRPCRVRASNMGHCLFSGIAKPHRVGSVGRLLMSEQFYSGWGIRTLAADQVRYNPMSYHNGSVWPHDNAIISEGFARYSMKEHSVLVLDGMFHLGLYTDFMRMPELICGFKRRQNQGPTLYPVACAPQAWSAASVFSLLGSCMGLEIRAFEKEILFNRPALPRFLHKVEVRGLMVGDELVDFQLTNHPHHVGVEVLSPPGGDLRVIIRK